MHTGRRKNAISTPPLTSPCRPSQPSASGLRPIAVVTAQQPSGNRVVNELPVTHGLLSPNRPSQTWRSSQFVRMHTPAELSSAERKASLC